MATPLPDGVRLLRTLTGHEGTIGRIGWSPDGHLLATPSSDRTVRIWDADSGICLRTISGHEEPVSATAFDREACAVFERVDAKCRISPVSTDLGGGRVRVGEITRPGPRLAPLAIVVQ